MLGEHGSVAAVALLFLLSLLGWGGMGAGLLRGGARSLLHELAARFVLGASLFYAGCLALGAVGRLHRLDIGAVMVLGVVVACPQLVRLAARASVTLKVIALWTRDEIAALAAVLILLALQWLAGLTPPVFYDAMVYHFFAPAQFLISGTFDHLPWNVYTNSPLALQLVVGMSLAFDDSGQSAKLLYVVLGGLVAVGAYLLLRPVGRRGALLGAVCVLSYPDFWALQVMGVTDLLVAGLLLLGFLWARESFKEQPGPAALLAGLALGLALGSRYQAIVLTAWILAATTLEALWRRRRPGGGRVLAPLVKMTSLIVLLTSPWLLRNLIHLGNPVFPLLPSLFGNGGEWSPAQSALFTADTLGPSWASISWLARARAPLQVFSGFPASGLFGLLLVLGGLAGCVMRKPELRMAASIGLGGLILWGFLRPTGGVPLLRFNALSITLLLAVCGAVLGSEWIPRAVGTGFVLALAAASLVLSVSYVHEIFPVVPSLYSRNVREGILHSSVPSWDAFMFVNQKLDPAHDKLLLVGETRGFWARLRTVAVSAFNGPQLENLFGVDSTPEAWKAALRHLGVTHMLISASELQRLRKSYNYFLLPPDQAARVNRWMQQLPKLFDDGHGTVVLAVEPVR